MKWFRNFLVGVLVVFALLVIGGLCFFHGWEDFAEGRGRRIAGEMFNLDSETVVDEVGIYLLQGEESDLDGNRFSLGAGRNSHETYGSVIVSGLAAYDFSEIWDEQTTYQDGAMCHDPAYGFRLYRNGKLVREAAICWGCGNFSYQVFPGKVRIAGFDSRSKEATALLEFCDKRLPYKKYEDRSEPKTLLLKPPFTLTQPALWFHPIDSLDPNGELGEDERSLLQMVALAFAWHTWKKEGADSLPEGVMELALGRIQISEQPLRLPSEILFPNGFSDREFDGSTLRFLLPFIRDKEGDLEGKIRSQLLEFDQEVAKMREEIQWTDSSQEATEN